MLSLLRDRRLWAVMGIILLGRMAWFAYWGVLLEVDSLGYLELQASLSHPPLYAAFNAVVLRCCDHLEAIVVAQCLLYAAAAAIFLRATIPSDRGRMWLAIALAIEPLSGKLACTLMAETLFLSLLLLALAVLPSTVATARRGRLLGAAALGLLMGAAYLTRYAAPVFVVAMLAWQFLQGGPFKRWAVTAIVAVVAFQLAVLPLRAYYGWQFGTLRFNGFSDLSTWNSAAYLYPGSSVAAAPDGEWETFLQTMPTQKFELYETWHTNQMFHDSCAYSRFVAAMDTKGKLAAARAAGATGWKLILDAPLRHLQDFILPNMARPFSKTDSLYADRLPPLIQHPLSYQPRQLHIYYPLAWWIYFVLLIAATGGYGWRRKTAPPLVGALLLCCWLYLAGISVLAVLFLRFFYLLGPLIVLALGMLGLGSANVKATTPHR